MEELNREVYCSVCGDTVEDLTVHEPVLENLESEFSEPNIVIKSTVQDSGSLFLAMMSTESVEASNFEQEILCNEFVDGVEVVSGGFLVQPSMYSAECDNCSHIVMVETGFSGSYTSPMEQERSQYLNVIRLLTSMADDEVGETVLDLVKDWDLESVPEAIEEVNELKDPTEKFLTNFYENDDEEFEIGPHGGKYTIETPDNKSWRKSYTVGMTKVSNLDLTADVKDDFNGSHDDTTFGELKSMSLTGEDLSIDTEDLDSSELGEALDSWSNMEVKEPDEHFNYFREKFGSDSDK